MATTRPQGDVSGKWKSFVRALRSVLGQLPEHRHQDQYVRVREAALTLAEGDSVAADIDHGYREAVLADGEPAPGAEAVEVAVMELEAYPLAVQIHESEVKAGTAKPGAAKRLRRAGKTIIGSVGDLFELSDIGKKAITVTKEAIELFDAD